MSIATNPLSFFMFTSHKLRQKIESHNFPQVMLGIRVALSWLYLGQKKAHPKRRALKKSISIKLIFFALHLP
jgi:hypothetical protein